MRYTARLVFSLFLVLYAVSTANADFRYSKPPSYDVISKGPGTPHIRSTINSSGYVRIYMQHKGDIYVMRKLRDSVSKKPLIQKLDAASAAIIRREYGDKILSVNSLDANITIDHETAGTYTLGSKGRVGWGGGSGSSSGGVDRDEQDRGNGNDDDYDDAHGGSTPLCQLTGTCGGGGSNGGNGNGSSTGGGSTGGGNGGGYNSSGGAGGTGAGIGLCYPASGNTVNVSGPSALQAALNAASPGSQLTLAPGTYSGTYTYAKNGTASAPIVIKGNGAAVFTGVFNLNGSYGVLSRVKFQGGRIAMNGHHNRVTRTLFVNPATPAIEMKSGGHAYNRIDHNEFRTVHGAAIEIGAQRNAARHQGHRIDHNYVFDHYFSGSEEVMRMLTDAYNDSYITYEYNLFDRVLQGERHQPELISVKTARTILRGNTVINSPNTALVFRETNRTLAEGNYLMDGASIYVFGDDNVVRNNYVTGAGSIMVRGGNGTMDVTRTGCPKSGLVPLLPNCKGIHAAARRTLVENNIGRISVGNVYPGNTVPAQNTTLRNNSGPISLLATQTGTVKTDGTPTNTAKRLGMNDVGVGPADVSCISN